MLEYFLSPAKLSGPFAPFAVRPLRRLVILGLVHLCAVVAQNVNAGRKNI